MGLMNFDHALKNILNDQGFFSKFLMGGTQNFLSPSKSDGGGGELAKKI